jgi:hypothetical protein
MPQSPTLPTPEKHYDIRRAQVEHLSPAPGFVVPGFIIADNKKNEQCKSKTGDPLGWFDGNMINRYNWAIVEWGNYDKIRIEDGMVIHTGKLETQGRGVLILDWLGRPTLEGVHLEKLLETCAEYGVSNIRWFPKPSFKEVKELLKRNDAKLVFNGATGCTEKGEYSYLSVTMQRLINLVWQLYITKMNDPAIKLLLEADITKSARNFHSESASNI